MREKRRLRMFENRVLRRIFGRKKEEGARSRKKLHNEELNDRSVLLTKNFLGDQIEEELNWWCM
jgi:hypothetical protein